MKSLTLIGIFVIFFCNLAKGEFEERTELSFQVRAIYKGEQIDSIGIRGNGLGLDVFTSQAMTKSEEEGVWTYDVYYKSDLYGFHCMNCSASSREIPNGDDFKVTFWAKTADSEANETRMVGDVFRIPLPQSKVSIYFEEKPVIDFYPYFFSKEGNFVTLDVNSENEDIGSRQMVVYLPPGFTENPRPEYDTYFVIDLSPLYIDLMRNEINAIFLDGVAHDAIVIGYGDWKPDPVTQNNIKDRMIQLTPVESVDFDCKEGTLLDFCNGCVPQNCTYAEFIYWMTTGGCGIQITIGGNAEANVEFLLTTVHKTVDEYLQLDYGSSLTKSRKGTFIIGYSLGGLFSCYASWTRPASFGGAACQSSSFGWPLILSEDNIGSGGFYFANITLNSHVNDRQPQRILIDVGGLEEDNIYQSVSSAGRIFDIMSDHPMFEANRNLWFHVYPNEEHSSLSWIKRVWNTFKMLSSGRN